MFSLFKKKKTITSSVSLEKNGLVFRFELSQEYDNKDNLLDIKTDQIINCIEMLNETISDLELQDKEEKKVTQNKAGK
jgi:hypothetical protein